MTNGRVGGSFRDPAGHVYRAAGAVYRRVDVSYQAEYDRLMASGLYAALVQRGWLVPHVEIDPDAGAYRTLRPEPIPYISYPYEWSFGQLKDAALLTLAIQDLSLSFGLTLKDASAYNVQFVGHRAVFIDTLSFEVYQDGAPWVAYRQFCEHFLAPLALMSGIDIRLRRLLGGYVDGVPLDLASALLPGRSWLRPGSLMHVHLHARSQRRHRDDGRSSTPARVPGLPKARLAALVDSLRRTIRGYVMPGASSEWGHYYDDTNYSAAAMAAKETAVRALIDAWASPGDMLHDLGANTGRFSQTLAVPPRYVVAHDIDELAVDRHYEDVKARRLDRVLPLVLDLTQPSPALGWALEERDSALTRIGRGTVLALALVHHLAIANNVPLPAVARFFGGLANTLVIEFVPKTDSQVRRLLASRTDIFAGYDIQAFERAFGMYFEIVQRVAVADSVRTLYAMRRK